MGKDKLETFVQSKLDAYSSPIDPAALWEQMEDRVEAPAATKSGAYLPWLLGSGLLVVLLGGMLFFMGSGAQNDMVYNTQNVNESNQSSALNSTEKLSDDLTNEKTINIEENSTINSALIVDENNQQKQSNAFKNNNPNKVINYAKGSTSKNTSEGQPVNMDDEVVVHSTNSMEEESFVYSESVEVASTKSAAIAGMQEMTGITQSRLRSTFISGLSLNELMNNSAELGMMSTTLPDKIVCPSFSNKGARSGGFFVGELQAIPFYSTPLFVAEDETGAEWLAIREATESYLEAFQVNLVGRYQMNNGLYLQGGIGYGQIDEKMLINESDFSVGTEENLPVIIIQRPNGINDTIPGTVEVTTESIKNGEAYNYHRMIELPFALGYEFNAGNNLGIYIDFGGSVNLSTFRSGYILDRNIDFVEFNDASNPIFRTSTGFKLNGGMGLRYYTPNRMVFSVGPEFRYHTNNWIRDEHPIQQRYFDVGLRLAAGYIF